MAGNSDPLQSPPSIDIGVVTSGTECECDSERASTHKGRTTLVQVHVVPLDDTPTPLMTHPHPARARDKK